MHVRFLQYFFYIKILSRVYLKNITTASYKISHIIAVSIRNSIRQCINAYKLQLLNTFILKRVRITNNVLNIYTVICYLHKSGLSWNVLENIDTSTSTLYIILSNASLFAFFHSHSRRISLSLRTFSLAVLTDFFQQTSQAGFFLWCNSKKSLLLLEWNEDDQKGVFNLFEPSTIYLLCSTDQADLKFRFRKLFFLHFFIFIIVRLNLEKMKQE